MSTTDRPAANPGEGWRLLSVGERKRDGDEYRSMHYGHAWMRTTAQGDEVRPHDAPYRRRVEAAQHPLEIKDPPTWGYDLWRMLADHGATLTESELGEVVDEAAKLRPYAEPEMRAHILRHWDAARLRRFAAHLLGDDAQATEVWRDRALAAEVDNIERRADIVHLRTRAEKAESRCREMEADMAQMRRCVRELCEGRWAPT